MHRSAAAATGPESTLLDLGAARASVHLSSLPKAQAIAAVIAVLYQRPAAEQVRAMISMWLERESAQGFKDWTAADAIACLRLPAFQAAMHRQLLGEIIAKITTEPNSSGLVGQITAAYSGTRMYEAFPAVLQGIETSISQMGVEAGAHVIAGLPWKTAEQLTHLLSHSGTSLPGTNAALLALLQAMCVPSAETSSEPLRAAAEAARANWKRVGWHQVIELVTRLGETVETPEEFQLCADTVAHVFKLPAFELRMMPALTAAFCLRVMLRSHILQPRALMADAASRAASTIEARLEKLNIDDLDALVRFTMRVDSEATPADEDFTGVLGKALPPLSMPLELRFRGLAKDVGDIFRYRFRTRSALNVIGSSLQLYSSPAYIVTNDALRVARFKPLGNACRVVLWGHRAFDAARSAASLHQQLPSAINGGNLPSVRTASPGHRLLGGRLRVLLAAARAAAVGSSPDIDAMRRLFALAGLPALDASDFAALAALPEQRSEQDIGGIARADEGFSLPRPFPRPFNTKRLRRTAVQYAKDAAPCIGIAVEFDGSGHFVRPTCSQLVKAAGGVSMVSLSDKGELTRLLLASGCAVVVEKRRPIDLARTAAVEALGWTVIAVPLVPAGCKEWTLHVLSAAASGEAASWPAGWQGDAAPPEGRPGAMPGVATASEVAAAVHTADLLLARTVLPALAKAARTLVAAP